MSKFQRVAGLVQRLLAGEHLTAQERALVEASATPRPAHRPAREDLKLAEDEGWRVLHFLNARLSGQGYQDALRASADASAISASRVKGALSWFSKTTGVSWQEALSLARTREERNTRIMNGGIDALTPNEIFFEGVTVAFAREFATRSRPKRAVLFVRHRDEVMASLDKIWERTRSLFESQLNSNLGAVQSLRDFAILLDEVATSVAREEVQKLDHLTD